MENQSEQSRFLQYLPAIYHQDRDRAEGSFLGEFLLPFEEVLASFGDLLSVIDRYIDPARTPAVEPQDFLTWLAGWVALVLDENWEEIKQRRLLREAVQLYRDRGLVAGLKRSLELHDDRLVVDVSEGRWPGGMQIGVASQIGGVMPEPIRLSRIERAERRSPPLTYDYYVVETLAPAGHPHVPEGQPLRLYYRTDRVSSVEVGGEGGQAWVILQLLRGEIRRHEPATVVRRDGLVNESYRLDLGEVTAAGPFFYKGDTFLIEEVERLYGFTVELQVPCSDWEFLFSFPIEPGKRPPLTLFRREFERHGITLSADATVTREKQGHRWWRIDDGAERYLALRKGLVLDICKWVGGKDWERARQPRNVQSIRAIIDEVKPAHTRYMLKLTPVVSKRALPPMGTEPMQIGLRSTVDVDTSIG